MKPLGIILTAAALALSAPAFAQNTDNPPLQERPAALQNGDAHGPETMGTTGWSGPHRGATSHPTAAGPTQSDSLDKQPPVATGEDLEGPAKAFPSNKAPE